MAKTSVTIPPQTYPIGETKVDHAGINPNITGVSVTLDCTNWATTPTVTALQLACYLSFDSGTTWVFSGGSIPDSPPPWQDKFGNPTSTTSFTSGWGQDGAQQPTNIRLSLIVIGTTSINLGQCTVTANQ